MIREDIICAGSGGQGIMLLGKFIAYGAMNKGFKVTWMPSYGAEVRGGTAYSMVVISDDDIPSPLVTLCDTAIIMNKPSFNRYISSIKTKGMLIANSSLIDADSLRDDIDVVKVPMTEIARRLGNIRIANVIALGVYINKKKLFSKADILDGLKIAFSGNEELIEINGRALEEGLNIR